jgi:hypothetical protein
LIIRARNSANFTPEQRQLAGSVRDLSEHRGSGVVIPGDHQPPLFSVAHALNQQLGNVGKTVIYTDPVDANPVNQTESLRDLLPTCAGKVDLLVIMGGNSATMRPSIWASLMRSRVPTFRCAFIMGSTRTKPPNTAIGT